MLSAVEGILLFVATTESALGVLGNGFIAFVNFTDYVKNRKFSKTDFLLTGLAISRISLLWVINIDGYINIFCPHMFTSGNLIEYVSYLWVTMNQLSIWFATSLNVFYFLKIANFSPRAFLWLKRKMNTVLEFLMVGLFVSCLYSVLQLRSMVKDSKMHHGNLSWQVHEQNSKSPLKQALFNLGVFALFPVALVACFLLIIFLWRHNRQMQSNVTGFRDINTEGHVKAIRVLVSFIALFILYFVGIAIEIACALIPTSKLLFILGLTAMSTYPCCHSWLLIIGNSKLKRASCRVLQQLKCWEKGNNLTAS